MTNFPNPPDDISITTLFITGIPENVDETKCTEFLRQTYEPFGVILKIKIVKSAKVAFVEFEDRESAQAAIMATFNSPKLDFETSSRPVRLKVSWARPRATITQPTVPYPSMDPRNVGNTPIPAKP
jgi:RNA recognition motif-containing protein